MELQVFDATQKSNYNPSCETLYFPIVIWMLTIIVSYNFMIHVLKL
jgi:hypothetical protein